MVNIVELRGPEFEKADKNVAILPVGSIERHGDHLPLGTDGHIPIYIAEAAGERLNCIVLPAIWYGSCKALREYSGTFDVDSDALCGYTRSVLTEAWRNGIRLVVVVNGHGGNSAPVSMAAREVADRTGLSVLVLDWWKDLGRERSDLFTSPGHAGEDETSAMLAISGRVEMGLAGTNRADYPAFRLYSREIDRAIYTLPLTGDARLATREKGREWLDAVIADLVTTVGEVKRKLGL
ncbi:MAG TPA: creatininase family protein [Candidatus Methanomethylicus sp.]|nr:creatininase family protein [Candidatus Methanomethylicus sp.]